MFFSHSSAWIRASRRAGWAVSFALAVLLLQSAFWSGSVPWQLKILVGAVALLAAVHPANALVAVAGLAPLGYVVTTSVWTAYPFSLSEALVLAFFAGYLWHRRPHVLSAEPDAFALPARLFALVVLASCAVELVVLQVWHDYPMRYALDFVKFLTTEYLTTIPDPRDFVDGRGFVSTAALLLEGVALVRCASALCAERPALARKLTTAIVAAGTAAALLTFYEIAATAIGNDQTFAEAFLATRRWSSPAIPSLDTVGVYFMFVAFAAAGVAAASRASLLPGLVAAGITVWAMWITRTRAAIVAGMAVVVTALFWRVCRRVRWPVARAALSALAGLAAAAAVTLFNPYRVLAPRGEFALHLRRLMAETALKIIASAPALGVGVGQYEARFPDFASGEILKYYRGINPHSYFLWIGAELGLLGLALFTWLLVVAFWRAWLQVREGPPRAEVIGVLAGLCAFLITWTIGQPLAVPQVAYTFWIALGMVAAPVRAPSATAWQRSLPARLAIVAIVVGVVASVPVRARRAVADIDLSRVWYGVYSRDETPDHRQIRWAGPHVTFFIRSSVRAIDVPLAANLRGAGQSVDAQVLVNQRPADHRMLSDREWHVVTIHTPLASGSTERYWRVDLNLTPVGIPSGAPDEEHRMAIGEIFMDRR